MFTNIDTQDYGDLLQPVQGSGKKKKSKLSILKKKMPIKNRKEWGGRIK